MEQFIEKFRTNWEIHFSKNQPVLLAVSAGVDSMVLADLLLKSEVNFAVAHCNFNLRGIDSEADEALVKHWCLENNLKFHTIKFDTSGYQKENKMGVQEAARKLRYDWLETLLINHNYVSIITAHHADDQTETVLMKLFKGTGIKGVRGMKIKNGKLFRPILWAEKTKIIEYANYFKIPFREDVSNTDNKYLRNEIRNEIIPIIKKSFPNAIAQICNSAERLSEIEMIYENEISKIKSKLIERRNLDLYIPIQKLKNTKPINTIIYELFKDYGFSASQTNAIRLLIDSTNGSQILSHQYKVIKNRDFLIITSTDHQETNFIQVEKIPALIKTAIGEFDFSKSKWTNVIGANPMLAVVKFDLVKFPLIIRHWKTGDYFYPLGMLKKKKLSRFFIDQKLSILEKEKVFVIENADKKIIWIAGMRLDNRFKITAENSEVLRMKFTPI